jgi:hypothetical protein
MNSIPLQPSNSVESSKAALNHCLIRLKKRLLSFNNSQLIEDVTAGLIFAEFIYQTV